MYYVKCFLKLFEGDNSHSLLKQYTNYTVPTPKGRTFEDALKKKRNHLKIITTLETNVQFPIALLTATQL